MAWQDRPYAYGDSQSGGRFGGFALPPAGRYVKRIIGICVIIWVAQLVFDRPSPGSLGNWGPMSQWLGATANGWWQLWRYITFQFLHDTNSPWHIILNMLGLYFLGSPLEAKYGSKRFLTFYLVCGALAGVAYVVIGLITGLRDVPIVGASGGIFAIMLADAVFFPTFQIIFLFFPVPIRLAAIIIFAIMGFTIFGSANAAFRGEHGAFARAMSDVCHLGGALAAAVWVLLERRGLLSFVPRRRRRGNWDKQMARRLQRQKEIDRILEKIHQKGLNSLSWSEKRFLKQATREQREEEQRISRM